MRTESPIEERFLEFIQPHLAPDAKLETQVDVPTPCGTFRLDFLLTTPEGRRVAVECDGAEFHDERRDEWRDALIVGTKGAHEIFRFRGQDIHHRIDDCLFIVARLHESLFTPRGLNIINAYASGEVADQAPTHDERLYDTSVVEYRGHPRLTLRYVHRHARRGGREPFWRHIYEYACKHPGQLDDVIARWIEEHPITVITPENDQ